MTIDDYEQAEEYLDKAEQIDPDAVMVEIMRPMLKSMRTLYTSNTSRQRDRMLMKLSQQDRLLSQYLPIRSAHEQTIPAKSP